MDALDSFRTLTARGRLSRLASPQTSGSGPRHPRLLLQPPHAVTLPHHGAVKTVDSLRVADLLPRILAQCRLDVVDDVDWRIVLARLRHLPQRGVEAEHQEDTQPDSHPDDEAKQGRGNEHVQSGDHLKCYELHLLHVNNINFSLPVL